jgi:uncharacterized protein YbbC (DUF1343 family)
MIFAYLRFMKKYFALILSFFCMLPALKADDVKVGAARIDQYIPIIQGKSVGLVVNQTSTIGNTHLLDTLISLGIHVQSVFAPEHGFRGTADAGEHVKNGVDPKTNVAIVSLYGDNKKPRPEQLSNIDILIFDIQDVGVRFYTYISTLQYVMEACAEQNKKLIVLDRPNPNGHYVDGPVLDTSQRSFVGMQPIPVVYGMTTGEYASMLNGESWLENKLNCSLTVIPCLHYDHKTFYKLPVKPSPNLSNMTAIYLYPSLCFFEGSNSVSVGRGTDKPFQIYGSPQFSKSLFSFMPVSKPGASKPFLQDQPCYGFDLSEIILDTLRKQKFTLKYLLNAYKLSTDKKNFFNTFFQKLAGTKRLITQIEKGMDEKSIRKTWQPQLASFKKIRKKYLLYKDFE